MQQLKRQDPCKTCKFSINGERSNYLECILCDYMIAHERSPCNICSNRDQDKANNKKCDECELRRMYNRSITDPRLMSGLKMLDDDRDRDEKIDNRIAPAVMSMSPKQSFREVEVILMEVSAVNGYGDDYVSWAFDLIIDHGYPVSKIAAIAGISVSTLVNRLPKTTDEMIKIGARVPVCKECGKKIFRHKLKSGKVETYKQYFSRQHCSKTCFKKDMEDK